MIALPSEPTGIASPVVTCKQIADMLVCSSRHVQRLRDSGAMPAAIRIGGLLRWNRAIIEKWIADGCPHCAEKASAE